MMAKKGEKNFYAVFNFHPFPRCGKCISDVYFTKPTQLGVPTALSNKVHVLWMCLYFTYRTYIVRIPIVFCISPSLAVFVSFCSFFRVKDAQNSHEMRKYCIAQSMPWKERNASFVLTFVGYIVFNSLHLRTSRFSSCLRCSITHFTPILMKFHGEKNIPFGTESNESEKFEITYATKSVCVQRDV